MGTFRIILPALITLVFSIILIWILAAYAKHNVNDKSVTKIINKVAWAITFLSLFFSIWWLVVLMSVDNIPRSVIDHSLNNQMRNNFEKRMVSDTTTKK